MKAFGTFQSLGLSPTTPPGAINEWTRAWERKGFGTQIIESAL